MERIAGVGRAGVTTPVARKRWPARLTAALRTTLQVQGGAVVLDS